MQVITIANQKGGCGKTATTHALGESLAALGRHVLLIDTDPQGSLTHACGAKDTAGVSLAEVLGGAERGRLSLHDIIQPISPDLDLAPADIALAGVELGLTSRLGREAVLSKSLRPVADRYDVCLIDCPPSLGLLTVGALVAADAVLIPSQPQAADLRGLRLFTDTLATIQSELNPSLKTLGVLVTFFDKRLNHHRAAVEAMSEAGLPVLPVKIGRSVRVAEAAGAGQSVITFQPSNPQAETYKQLAEVVNKWLNVNSPT